jgi:hypothetical protein
MISTGAYEDNDFDDEGEEKFDKYDDRNFDDCIN